MQLLLYPFITHDVVCDCWPQHSLLPRDLRALLKLLTHLTQRDLVDFGSDDGGRAVAANGTEQSVDVAQLVFLGLDILIPLISLELLGFPKLCLLYFQLLAYMMEVSCHGTVVCKHACNAHCNAVLLGEALHHPCLYVSDVMPTLGASHQTGGKQSSAVTAPCCELNWQGPRF